MTKQDLKQQAHALIQECKEDTDRYIDEIWSQVENIKDPEAISKLIVSVVIDKFKHKLLQG